MKHVMQEIKNILKEYLPLVIILLISGFIFFSNLSRDLLTDWDECIYASYARTMHQSGDFFTHQWNGLPTLEKPPLLAWVMQPPFVFGVNEFTARFPTVLFGLILIAAVYHFGKKYFSEKVAVIATLLLLTSEVVVRYMTRVNTDIGYTTFIFLGVYSWLLSSKKEKWTYVSGLFFALAVLIKGPGIIPFLGAILVSIFINFKKESVDRFVKMVVTTFLIILPWHIIQYIFHGERFIQIYIRENIIQRAKYPLEFHFEGRLFYIKMILHELFPWIAVAILPPIYYIVQFSKVRSVKKIVKELKGSELIITIALCILIPLVSITHIKTRIAWYAMPIYPFLSIFLACSIQFSAEKLKIKWVTLVIISFLCFDALHLIAADTRFYQKERQIDSRHAVFLEAKKRPEEELEYLVQFSERQGRQVLNPNLYTSTTWIYGGNPCAVYYSQKKVHYYYSIDEFLNRLKKPGLFVVENGDLHVIEESKTKKIYENEEFTMVGR